MGYKFKEFKKEEYFKFGDEVFKTERYKRIPIKIGSMEEMLEIGILDTDIPLLLSGNKLEEWGA